MVGMTHRSPARFMAPIALLAIVLVLVLIIAGSGVFGGGSSSSDDGNAQRSTPSTSPPPSQKDRKRGGNKDVYVVKEGDSLASISESTGVPVETLQELNPDVDPQALQTGQRIKLKK